MTITKVIKALYVKLGGSLTDTISGIAGGIPVAEYTVISDCIKALYVLYGGDLSEVYSGISDVAVKDYTSVSKALAALAKVAFKGITPTGKKTITENGTNIDVAQYATADVDVPQGIMVDEDYTIKEGKLTAADIQLNGEVIATIPNGVTEIGNRAFYNNVLINKAIIPNTVTTIENGYSTFETVGAFAGCQHLTTVILSNTLTTIGDYSFYNAPITSISIPDSVETIGKEAFYNCGALTSLNLSSVRTIGMTAFGNCNSLTTVNFGNSVETISQNAFFQCSALSSIVLPLSITSIGDSAFYSTSLTDIYYAGTQAQWETITITGEYAIPAGATIHYEYTPS